MSIKKVLKNYIFQNQNKYKLVHYFADEPRGKYACVNKPWLYEEFKKRTDDVFLISAVSGENIDSIKYFMGQKVDEIEKPVSDVVVEDDPGASDNDDSAYEISKVSKDTYIIVWGKIGRLAQVTDERNPEQVIRFQNILTGMGVFDKLKAMGVKDGDTIIVGHLEFAYYADEFFG